jgi:HSP20 family protein
MDWFEDPFEELERIRRRIDNLARRMFRGAWEPLIEEVRPVSFPVDISETEDEIKVQADLPGFRKEDINLRVTEDTIEISAQRREEKREKTERMIRAERRVGSVRRFLTLPTKIDTNTVDAEFRDGVLIIRAKKIEKKKGKEIKIK